MPGNSLWVQHTLRSAVRSTVFKNWTAQAVTPYVPGAVISAYQQRFNRYTPAAKMPRADAVLTYYVAGIAVMLWMSPSMTLIVICVLAALTYRHKSARRRVFAQTGLPQIGWRT